MCERVSGGIWRHYRSITGGICGDVRIVGNSQDGV